MRRKRLKDWHDVGKKAAEILNEVDQMELRKRNADRRADTQATDRGEWPPSQSEPAVPVPINPRDLILPSLGPLTPSTVKDLASEPTNAREILFAHMIGGLEMLRAMALSPDVPLGIRKDTAALLAKIGASAMPKRTESVSTSLSRLQIEKIAGSLDQVSAESLAEMLGSVEPERGALTAAPPPPPIDVTPVHLATRNRLTVEERIRRVLKKRGDLTLSRLVDGISDPGWKPPEDWSQVLEDLIRRGVVTLVKPTGMGRRERYTLVKKIKKANGNGKVAG